jgi:Tol biopolymer transport system component
MSIRLVLGMVAMGITASFPALAQAQPQGAPILVYDHVPDGGPPWPVTDVYTMSADGSNSKALTNDGHSHNPTWSPDGQRILFVHDAVLSAPPLYREPKEFESYHPVELYVMNKDGSNRSLLRRLGPVIHSVAWSPDGKTLAIAGVPEAWVNRKLPNGDPMRGGLFLLPSDGKGELRLLFFNAFTPAWSPSGKRLAFSLEQPRGLWAVHVANADGSNDVELTDPKLIAGSPAWSPDGRQIAFDEFVDQGSRQQIFTMDANGAHVRPITTDPNWSCEHPSWSPDGLQIAFFCRSAAAPCGRRISDTGTPVPECDRRIFVASPADPKPKLVPLNPHDGASPEFAPARRP